MTVWEFAVYKKCLKINNIDKLIQQKSLCWTLFFLCVHSLTWLLFQSAKLRFLWVFKGGKTPVTKCLETGVWKGPLLSSDPILCPSKVEKRHFVDFFPQSPAKCFLITACHSPTALVLGLSCLVVDHYNKPNTKNKPPTRKWHTYNPTICRVVVNYLACPAFANNTVKTYIVKDKRMYCIAVFISASDPLSQISVKIRETDATEL